MNTSVLQRAGIFLRPATDQDIAFLRRLYASTRTEELQRVPWTDEQKSQFIDMQFRAQKIYYEEIFPKCEFLIIEQDHVPAGRLYVDRQETEIHIADILVAPEYRARGIGNALMLEILSEAELKKQKVTIYVESFNPARRWYDKLGFQQIDTNGVHHLMEWRAVAQ